MTPALPMVEPAGYAQIISENGSNIINASLTSWNTAGDSNMPMLFSFGIIPLLVMMMVYMRNNDSSSALFAGSITSGAMWAISSLTNMSFVDSKISFGMTVILLGLWIYSLVFGHAKEN